MATLPELLDRYSEGPTILRRAVTGMSREQLLARPIAGKWSTLEVVCHLADFEPVFADRIKRVIALDRPSLLGADETRFAVTLAYHERDIEEELAVIDLTRRQLARILLAQPADVLSRVGIHNERGPRTLEQLLTGAVNHVAHHVPFITAKRDALRLPA